MIDDCYYNLQSNQCKQNGLLKYKVFFSLNYIGSTGAFEKCN